MSLRESPRVLIDNIVIANIAPGNNINHQAVLKYLLASFNNAPHSESAAELPVQ